MRLLLFSAGNLWVLLSIMLPAPAAAEALPFTRHPELSFQGYYLVDSEYLPQIKQKLATLVEWGGQSQFSLSVNPALRFQFGVGHGTVRQENELVGDDDYALKRKTIFVDFSLMKTSYFSAQGRIAYERFTNDGQEGYYRLENDENLLTGSMNWTWQNKPWRVTGKYYRSRETDPVYDIADQRALLKLEARDLTGIEIGYRLDSAWEAAVSLYHENYGTEQTDQFNLNGQVAFRTGTVVLSRVAAGAGYYFEEEETILNLTLEGGSLNKNLSLGWYSEIEWADVDASVLVGGSFWCRLGVSRYTALKLQLQGEQEMGDDKDSLLAAHLTFSGTF